jgi:hypothetical protein
MTRSWLVLAVALLRRNYRRTLAIPTRDGKPYRVRPDYLLRKKKGLEEKVQMAGLASRLTLEVLGSLESLSYLCLYSSSSRNAVQHMSGRLLYIAKQTGDRLPRLDNEREGTWKAHREAAF